MSDTFDTLQKMSEAPHDYDIGHWWNAVDLAIDEIERLRGLLRDADDGLDDYWVTTKDGVDWMRRVREALGE